MTLTGLFRTFGFASGVLRAALGSLVTGQNLLEVHGIEYPNYTYTYNSIRSILRYLKGL